jgi:molecular chaperone GrpE (heat shock protein)
MSTITVDENQLEEIVSKVVQQHLKLTFQDMDEVRKSPAGAIVRLETKIESLTDAVDELRAEIANSRAELKEESGKLRIETQ